jgi:hypothetical protein
MHAVRAAGPQMAADVFLHRRNRDLDKHYPLRAFDG